MKQPRNYPHILWHSSLAGLFSFVLMSNACAAPNFDSPQCQPKEDGSNPCPIHLTHPVTKPLSAMAELGHLLFFDTQLSGSRQQSCASCHSPQNHYGPAPTAPDFALGGITMQRHGRRAVPSISYLEQQPPFSIGPDDPTSEAPPPLPPSTDHTSEPVSKSSHNTASSATNLVPQGGLFWDGRVDTLQQQAVEPLYNPDEMANTPKQLLHYLQHSPYTKQLEQLAGPAAIKAKPDLLIDEAAFAIGRYEIEAKSFHPYNSDYDHWLEGTYRFIPSERRGYILFNDPQKGNCAACHLSHPGGDGHTPPLFTDTQYEALGVPHNPHAQSGLPDLGLCRNGRAESQQEQYCGFFKTPSLRNTATRPHFFHNSVFHTLAEVLGFYAKRPIPANDLPARYQKNLDVSDHPFDRKPTDPQALSKQEQDDIIAFLRTLTDHQ